MITNLRGVFITYVLLVSVCFTIICLIPVNLFAQGGSGRIDARLLRAVVKIVGTNGTTGTGFLLREYVVLRNARIPLTFLVTNKHMLGDWNISNGSIQNYNSKIEVFLYAAKDSTGLTYKSVTIDLGYKNRFTSVLVHPNPKIDIAIVLVSKEVSFAHSESNTFGLSYLLDFDKITSEAGLGDQVFALGYPGGITSLKNNYPIAKAGSIASLPGEEFVVDIPYKDYKNLDCQIRVEGKIVLIDGLLVAGNSGSPIVLPGVTVRRDPVTGDVQILNERSPNYVIGIQSSVLPSGLSIVYSSDYIKELVSLFIKYKLN